MWCWGCWGRVEPDPKVVGSGSGTGLPCNEESEWRAPLWRNHRSGRSSRSARQICFQALASHRASSPFLASASRPKQPWAETAQSILAAKKEYDKALAFATEIRFANASLRCRMFEITVLFFRAPRGICNDVHINTPETRWRLGPKQPRRRHNPEVRTAAPRQPQGRNSLDAEAAWAHGLPLPVAHSQGLNLPCPFF